jgi:biotin transport system substrate-specific component
MNSKLRTIDLTLASMFVALMAVGANPFMVVDGVPITLQTFFAILTRLVLGAG